MQSANVGINSSYETKSLDRSRENFLHFSSGQNSLGFNTFEANMTNTPFQATLFWNDLVNHFRTCIQIKQKRIRFKRYDSCFSGSEAVTLVYNYLRQPRQQTNNRIITRENAVKVCKLLFKSQVIEPVNILKQNFDDSSSKLYRVSTTRDDAPWFDILGCHHDNKPQTEVLRPKHEQNFLSFECRRKESSIKSKEILERNGCGGVENHQFSKKTNKFGLFHKWNKDVDEDDYSSDDDDDDDDGGGGGEEKRDSENKNKKVVVSTDDQLEDVQTSDHQQSTSDYTSSISSLPTSSSSSTPSSSSPSSSSAPSSSAPSSSPSPTLSLSDVHVIDGKLNGSLEEPQTSSSSPNRLHGDRGDLESIACDEIIRQTILSNLLKTVDLPFIESLVHPIESDKIRSVTLPFKGNACLSFQASTSDCHCCLLLKKALNSELSMEEVWWTVSIKLLNFLSETKSCSNSPFNSRRNVSSRRKRMEWLFGFHCLEDRKSEISTGIDDEDVRSKVFSTIVAEHRVAPEPLWSAGHEGLHAQILNLLVHGKIDEARLATQMSLHLLPWIRKEHVTYLLLFMRLCKMDASFDCNKMLGNKFISTTINRQAYAKISLEDCFEGCIIREGAFSPHQSHCLLSFMTDNLEKLFTLSTEVSDAINSALEVRKSGGGEYLPEIIGHCRRLSLQEYEEEKVKYTEISLVQLMNHIIDSTQYTLKDKKSKLKNFAKHHSTIYKRYFRDVL